MVVPLDSYVFVLPAMKNAEGETGIAFPVTVLTMTSFRDEDSFSIFIQPSLTIFGPHIDHGIFMSAMHVSPELDLNLTDCYIYVRCSRLLQFFYLIPYNLGSLYLVHAMIMVYSCLPCMCHLSLTSI